MSITSGFFNSLNGDRTYNADQMSEYFKGIISDGVVENIGGALQVMSSTGMNVNVKTGRAFIDSRWFESDAIETIAITSAHATLNRYTAIVIRLNYTNRTITLETKDGTPATTPTKPAITRSEQIKELCLAYVYVAAAATSISQTNITDTRANTNICGWVTGVIDQVDTSTLFAQWESAYDENIEEMESWEATQKAAFESWLATLTEQLQIGAYIKEFNKNIILGRNDSRTIPLNMTNYTYESTDVFIVTMNGLTGIKNTDWTLNTGVTPPTITVTCNTKVTNDAPDYAKDHVEIKILKTILGVSS